MTEKYVSIDLDFPTKLRVVRTWHNIQEYGGTGPYGRVSSSGHGVHIRNRRILPETVHANDVERLTLGDDTNRVREDVENDSAPNQLLWDVKGGERPGEWHENLDSLLSEYNRNANKTPLQLEATKQWL